MSLSAATVCNIVEKYREKIFDVEQHIWKNPETGYREWKTTEYLAKRYQDLGYELHFAGDIPGFYTDIETGRPGPKILVLGELDALIIPEHPAADPQTGAAHACGHNGQCAALYGVAAALTELEILNELCGSIRLCAVPAEELIEIEYREELLKNGTIHYLTGKAEYLYRGYFDGVDIAFMVHNGESPIDNCTMCCVKGCAGSISKKITFQGKATHAAYPESGINAQHAQTLAVNAINSLRDTFNDEDGIRVHYIVTEGGTAVNAVPDIARMEMMIRAKTTPAMVETNERVNRAIAAAAASIGAKVHISDKPAYAALTNDDELTALAKKAMEQVYSDAYVFVSDMTATGSTDMGFLSMMMPTFHPSVKGGSGELHSKEYHISDSEFACVTVAKLQVQLLNLLLSGHAEAAQKVLSEFQTLYKTKDEVLKELDRMCMDKDAVIYEAEGKISLDYRK